MLDEKILAFSRVTAPGTNPAHWMILLHGIFGSGGNLRTFARRLTERQPSWGFILPDLRGHGGSLGLPKPDSFAEAAQDIVRLEAALGHPIDGLAGHSFGGKVALARLALGPPAPRRLQPPAEVLPSRGSEGSESATVHGSAADPFRFVLLDSAPGADPSRMIRDQAGRILALLEGIERPLPSRESFIAAILAAGHSRPIAEWLAMQVRRLATEDGGARYELRLDLPAIRTMLEGYFATDLWTVIERPPEAVDVLVVTGGKSTVVGDDDLERLRRVAARVPRLELRVLARAGHWLHADDLEGLVDAVAPHLGPRPEPR